MSTFDKKCKTERGVAQPRVDYKIAHKYSKGERSKNEKSIPNQQTLPSSPNVNDHQGTSQELEDTVGPYVPGQMSIVPYATPYSTPYGDSKFCPCTSNKIDSSKYVSNYAPEVCVKKEPGTAKMESKPPFAKTRPKQESSHPTDDFEDTHPETSFKIPNMEIPKINTTGPTACYMPQITDAITYQNKPMGPIGPWASGDLNWAPLAGLTGTRPVVDKYTITRFSEAEWRTRNGKLVTDTRDAINQSSIAEFQIQQNLQAVSKEADRIQQENTKRLEDRANEILRWKCQLERAIIAANGEINDLERDRTKLKQAGAVLTLPEMIVGEALSLRTSRIETELVRDDVEEELMKEYALIHEIRDVFERSLDDINRQMAENKTAKTQLEFDWSDKTLACEIDMLNASLNNRSNVILFKPGSTRMQMDQATPEHWLHFTKESIDQGERTRRKSFALRSSLDSILLNAARDLRGQADRVDNALQQKVNCVKELLDTLEDQLQKVLKTIAQMEMESSATDHLIRRLDMAMKVAQTRLDNRTNRMRVENVRDPAQYGLIDEIKQIGQQVTSLKSTFDASDSTLGALIKNRSELERNIMFLRKTLLIDRDRIGKLRSFYPSAAALMGKG